ncbi:TATE DNA transposon [Leptomonas pyrrhocoris]|uniref:TATE DNA transposon n=2 Tax=Leptomonas pyrrhocoris TaxID=157538 RepID=A0A0N0DYC9_LEPPY|nr:TATE DNA transposon [Leptomonas pyrrhocoris]KPA83995.1 TATE DNA transposon [Leptomonas pyrrhocoris]|eukprot:XP_015662434.1 TATE DNA transposon [Leptomonas pyrrhocoris]
MTTTKPETRAFLGRVGMFFTPEHFTGFRTSRTIKKCHLPMADIDRAVEMGKMELCPAADNIEGKHLPEGVHGVNVFAVPEMKGRRRLITEPHLNACLQTSDMPKVQYPTRLERRQSLRNKRYMLQVDFEAYYDATPLPGELRNFFVFRARNGAYFRLCTLPTEARWSVAVGQGITSTIVDVDTPVTIMTMIDNILIAADEGQEEDFVSAVRRIVARIRGANLLTSPDRESLATMDDTSLLSLAKEPNTVFLGEEYRWNGSERLVRNSAKSVAKLIVALRKPAFTIRSFASVVSLMFYMLHTTLINPARAFSLARAYRGAARLVSRGFDWDDPLPFLHPQIHAALHELGARLVHNPWQPIARERSATYSEDNYDVVCFTDASLGGWGAYAHKHLRNTSREAGSVGPLDGAESITAYQQMWVNELEQTRLPRARAPLRGRDSAETDDRPYFMAKHSAHAEPRAAELMLRQLVEEGLPDGAKIALVTDHFPIVHAQKQLNGFGGIGRGLSLNKLYEYAYDVFYERGISVVFFYIAGPMNPADTLSRNFGDFEPRQRGSLARTVVNDVALPLLCNTFSPLCEGKAEVQDGWAP